MLYHSYELRRFLAGRVAGVATLNARALTHLPGPLQRTAPVRSSLALAEVAEALQLTHVRPPFRVDAVEVAGETVAVHEETVMSTPFGSLVRFVPETTAPLGDRPKVLIVPGLAGHFATLVRGTVQTLLADHDVYVADWHNARDVPIEAGRFGLDEFIEHLMDFLRVIGPGTHLMAICQPVVACLAAAAIMAEDGDESQPRSVILLAGPVDARVNPGRVNKFAQRQSRAMLERTVIVKVPSQFAGAGRRVYPGFLQVMGFVSMDPRRHASAFRGMFRDIRQGDTTGAERTKVFYEEYFAVLDIAAEFYLETAERVFQNHDMARGVFTWRGRHVDPGAITSALMTIEGAKDEMAPPGQTEAAHTLCTGIPASRHVHLLQDGVGHYGVFAGSKFDQQIYPKVTAFIAAAEKRARSGRRAKASV